jgi:hypothetical protein
MAEGLTTAKIKVTAILQNPTGIHEDLVPVQYPEGRSHAAVFQFIGAVTATGGIIREIGKGSLQLIPLCRVVTLDAEIVDEKAPSGIITEGVGNLAALNAAMKANKR